MSGEWRGGLDQRNRERKVRGEVTELDDIRRQAIHQSGLAALERKKPRLL
jgi:hypothetical protein